MCLLASLSLVSIEPMSSTTFEFKPVQGQPVRVNLIENATQPNVKKFHVINAAGKELGEVWKDRQPPFGWKWKRSTVQELRGGGYKKPESAVTELLWELRLTGRV